MKRTAPIRVISFLLLGACGALCQSEHPSVDLLQGDGSNSPEVQYQEEMRTWRSLPEAPSSVQPPTRAKTFQTFVNGARSPLTFGTVGISVDLMRRRQEPFAPGMQTRFSAFYRTAVLQKESSTFLDKYLYPSLLKQNLRYHPSTSGSFMGRATDAVSRIFITRDDSGKGRLNTPYFLGVLTSVAVHTAYRPYWARSPSATFNNFGSTISSGAGMNLLHEFGPGIRQMVKGHTPKFVFRIEDGAAHDQTPKNVVSAPAK